MQNEKNQKIELTPEQQAPGRAKAEDFEIVPASEAAKMKMPAHGQRGRTKEEYERLLAESDANRPITGKSGVADHPQQLKTANEKSKPASKR